MLRASWDLPVTVGPATAREALRKRGAAGQKQKASAERREQRAHPFFHLKSSQNGT